MPFLRLDRSIVLLRILVAFIFIAHAVTRIANGTIERFGGFLESRGLPFGVPQVWAITAFEIIGGLLMAVGWRAQWFATGFIGMLLAGIWLIHRHAGWFVGEHGTGGSEYSVVLIGALLVVAAADQERRGLTNRDALGT